MKNNPYRVFMLSLTILMVILIALMNVQLFLFVNSSTPAANSIEPQNADEPKNSTLSETNKLASMSKQLDERLILADFADPAYWHIAGTESHESGTLSLTPGDNTISEMYRKFDSFIALRPYIYVDIGIENVENIEWCTLYLMEDLTYANYLSATCSPPRYHRKKSRSL